MLLNLIIEKRAESPLCPESQPFFFSLYLWGGECAGRFLALTLAPLF